MTAEDAPASPACPACGAALPVAFPGASVTCTCGRRVEVAGSTATSRLPSSPPRAAWSGATPSSDAPRAGEGGPYRAAAHVQAATTPAPCPYCGNDCPPLVRICPHCDVRLDSVRCQQCYSLQPPGAFACGRCSRALDLEPLLDATDAPCPRCRSPLEVAPGDDARIHECPRCGGMFVSRDALAEIMARAEVSGTLRESVLPPRAPLDSSIRYVMCPQCHASMNRVNFGKLSGVIVDVCKAHGTWFDAGELTRVVAFVGAGGLDRMRERESGEKKQAKKLSAEAQAAFAVFEAKERAKDRVEVWEDLLRVFMGW